MNNYKAIIEITLRKGILDVQGKAVEHALHSIEFKNINDVRIGKLVELSINAETKDRALDQIANACKQLIANPIIEDFKIEIN